MGAFDRDREIVRQGDYLLMPIKHEIILPKTEIVFLENKESKRKPASLKEALEDKLTKEETADSAKVLRHNRRYSSHRNT